MKLKKIVLLVMEMLAISTLGIVGQSHSANLGLLVKNSSSLDVEEQAAYNFATSRGFTVTKIDPAAILTDPNILNTVNGFWAANNSAPSGFNDPTVSASLKSQLEGGKGLLITWYGNYLAQYLGLGTASLGSSWNPVVSDHEYWVDKIDDHPIFENLTPWVPPSGPPDDDSKLLYYVTPGYISVGKIRVNWSIPYTDYHFARLWTSYGWCGQSFDPALQQQYGITGTCERSIQITRIREATVGSGSVVMTPCSMAGGDHWHWGEMGFQMLENMLTYVCSGGQPPQGSILEIASVTLNQGEKVVSGKLTEVHIVLRNRGGISIPAKNVNVAVFALDRCDYPPGIPAGNPWCAIDDSRTYLHSAQIFENVEMPEIRPCEVKSLPTLVTIFSGGGYVDQVLVVIKSVDGTCLADMIAPLSQQPQDWYEHESGCSWLSLYKDQTIDIDPAVNCFWEIFSLLSFGPTNLLRTGGNICGYLKGLSDIWPHLTVALNYASQGDVDRAFEEGWIAAQAAFDLTIGIMGNEALQILLSLWSIVENEINNRGCIEYIEELKQQFWLMLQGGIKELSSVEWPQIELPPIVVHVGSPVDVIVRNEFGDTLRLDSEGNLFNSIDSAYAVRAFEDDYFVLPSGGSYSLTVIARDTGWCHIAFMQPFAGGPVYLVDYEPIRIEDNSIARLDAIDNTTSDYTLEVDKDGDGQYERKVTPASITIIAGPGFASLSGVIDDDAGYGLLGISVDIYDSLAMLWKSVVTDDSGYYHIDSIPNGHYTATVVTPLGYQADQETKEFTVHHVPVRVDFSLTKLDITPGPRSRAYWAHQLHKALKNKPKDYTVDDFSNFVGLINVHFNQNQINPVDFYSVPQPADQTDSLKILKKLLHMRNIGEWEPSLKRLAKAQLIALMLNVVSGKISQTEEISEDGRTVSQAITYCDLLVNDEIDCPDGSPGQGSPLCRYIRAGFILTFANLGITVPGGLIPEDVTEIAYKIRNQEDLPEGFGLHQNYPNPFNPDCEISYTLPTDADVSLSIYNLLGQKVRTLVDEYQPAGHKIVHWDGADDNGNKVASGIYFYRLKAGDYTETKKMILMK